VPHLRPNSLVRRPSAGTNAPAPEKAGGADPEAQDAPRSRFRLGPQYQFVSVYNPTTSVYRKRFDEALRNDPTGAVQMWRDGLIQEQLDRRWEASRNLPWHLEPDNPRDKGQKAAAEKYTRLIASTPRYDDYLLALQESCWYGRSGAQNFWGRKMVNGSWATVLADHISVNGDSVGYHHHGIPKIQIASIAEVASRRVPPTVIRDDVGYALLLDTRYWRDCFSISRYKPHAPDWGREPEMALAMYGLGLRGRLYWTWWLRQEVTRWHLDALERIGSNGMLMGFYPSGDDKAMHAMVDALKQIQRENVAAFPVQSESDPATTIKEIPPAPVAYEVQAAFIDKCDGIIKRMICGTEGEGGGSADNDAMAEGRFQSIMRADASRLADTLTTDLLGPLIRFNDGSLPFGLKVVLQTEKKDVGERTAAIQMLYQMRIPMDREDIYDAVGMSPPRDDSNIVLAPDPAAGAGTGGPVLPGSSARGIPPGSNPNLPRSVRGAGNVTPVPGARPPAAHHGARRLGFSASTVGRAIRKGGAVHNSRDGDGDNCGDGSGGFEPGNECATAGGEHEDGDHAPSEHDLKASLDSWRDTFNEGLNDFRSAGTDAAKAEANRTLAVNSLDYLDEVTQGSVGRHPKMEAFALTELDSFARKLPSDAPAYDVDESGHWTIDGEPAVDPETDEPIEAEWDEDDEDWDRTPADEWSRSDLAEYDGDTDAETAENLESGGLHKEAAMLAAGILRREAEHPGSTGEEADTAVEILKQLMGGES
jgi:hypothetical protein